MHIHYSRCFIFGCQIVIIQFAPMPVKAEAWASADEILHIWDYHKENPKVAEIGQRRTP